MDRGVPTTVDATRLRYQLALETSMDGFALVGTEGRLLEVNQALCSISRCPRAMALPTAIAAEPQLSDPPEPPWP